MAIHIVLGFKDPGAQSAVEPVYVGRSATDATAARDAYQGASTLWLRNPSGIRKQNSDHSAARDRVARDEEIARLAALPAPVELSAEAKLARAENENAKLKKQLSSAETLLSEHASAAIVPVTVSAELLLVDTTLPKITASELEDGGEPVDDSATIDAGAVVGDPAEEERRKAALAMSEAAEKIKETPKGKNR